MNFMNKNAFSFLALTSLTLVFSTINTSPLKAEPCKVIHPKYGATTTNCLFPGGGGIFRNDRWEVAIANYEEDYFIYRGRDLRTGNSLQLSSSQIIGTTERASYVFRNGIYSYTVTIQPSDPNVIRLEVSQYKNELLNVLLYRVGNANDAFSRFGGY